MSKSVATLDGQKKSRRVDWHRADVVCGLWKLGTSMERLSREHGYATGALRNALNIPWPKAERILAEALGVTPQDIWPSRYREDGTPKSGRGERGLGRYKRKSTNARPARNGNHRQAA